MQAELLTVVASGLWAAVVPLSTLWWSQLQRLRRRRTRVLADTQAAEDLRQAIDARLVELALQQVRAAEQDGDPFVVDLTSLSAGESTAISMTLDSMLEQRRAELGELSRPRTVTP